MRQVDQSPLHTSGISRRDTVAARCPSPLATSGGAAATDDDILALTFAPTARHAGATGRRQRHRIFGRTGPNLRPSAAAVIQPWRASGVCQTAPPRSCQPAPARSPALRRFHRGCSRTAPARASGRPATAGKALQASRYSAGIRPGVVPRNWRWSCWVIARIARSTARVAAPSW